MKSRVLPEGMWQEEIEDFKQKSKVFFRRLEDANTLAELNILSNDVFRDKDRRWIKMTKSLSPDLLGEVWFSYFEPIYDELEQGIRKKIRLLSVD